MDDATVKIRGFSLATFGLEGAIIVHADGAREPLEGFLVKEGKTILDSIVEALPEGSELIVPPERPDPR